MLNIFLVICTNLCLFPPLNPEDEDYYPEQTSRLEKLQLLSHWKRELYKLYKEAVRKGFRKHYIV